MNRVPYGGEGLAPETEGGDGGQVLEGGELRRGEPLADDGEVGAPDSRSVVADLDQLQATLTEDHCGFEETKRQRKLITCRGQTIASRTLVGLTLILAISIRVGPIALA